MEDAGLQDITARSYTFKKLEQFVNEFKTSGIGQSFKGGYVLLRLYLTKPVYRKAMNTMGSVYMLAGNEIPVLKGNFDCLKSSGILNFYEKPIPPLAFTLSGCPS